MVEFVEHANAKTSSSRTNQTNYTQQPCIVNGVFVLHLQQADMHAYIFPKTSDLTAMHLANINKLPPNDGVTHDVYRLTSCRPISFYQQDLMYCEGEQTTIIFTQPIYPTMVEQLGAHVALWGVLYEGAKQLYKDYMREKAASNPANAIPSLISEERQTRLLALQTQLAELERNIKHDVPLSKWVKWSIEDFRDCIKKLNKKNCILISEIDELEKNITYFCNDVPEALTSTYSQREEIATNTVIYKADESETTSSHSNKHTSTFLATAKQIFNTNAAAPVPSLSNASLWLH